MTRCCVRGCPNKSLNKSHGITSHRFPKDEKLKRLWIKAVGRGENWEPSTYSKICSMHFSEEMIDRTKSNVKLHKHAVPFPNFTVSPQESKMDAEAVGNAHIVRVVPVASESNMESKDDECVNESACAMEESVSEAGDTVEDEENDPLAEEICTAKTPATEFVTYLVIEPDKKLPNSSHAYSLVRSNNVCSEEKTKIKNVISNVLQLESQVKVGEDISNAELSQKLTILENKLKQAKDQREKDMKRISTLTRSLRRSVKKIAALNETIEMLKQRKFAAHKNLEILEKASPLLLELLNWRRNLNKSNTNSTNSVRACEFVKQLYTISPDAYQSIRDYLILTLPHARAVKKWNSDVNLTFNGEKETSEGNSTSAFVNGEDTERSFSFTESGNVNGQENNMFLAVNLPSL